MLNKYKVFYPDWRLWGIPGQNIYHYAIVEFIKDKDKILGDDLKIITGDITLHKASNNYTYIKIQQKINQWNY